MKTWTKKLIIPFLLVLALLTTSVIGCKTEEKNTEPDTENTAEDAPTIPPLSTFLIDFDNFNSTGDTTTALDETSTSAQPLSYIFCEDSLPSVQLVSSNKSNWTFAALGVGVWSAIIVVGSAIPVAAFTESFNHTPQQQQDYSWKWTYSVKVGLFWYTAELVGKFIDTGVRFEMYISQQGGYQDFLWFYGESNLQATDGFWVLKDNATSNTDLIQIDWTRNLTDSTYSIKYTNIVPDGPENGGYIAHGGTTEDPYNRYFDIYNKGADRLTNIEWDSSTKAGRVKAPFNFGDDEWHYWDASHENTSGGV